MDALKILGHYPTLKTYTKKAWLEFQDEYSLFQAKDNTVPMAKLIANHVLMAILLDIENEPVQAPAPEGDAPAAAPERGVVYISTKLQLQALTNERLTTMLNKLFLPVDSIETLEELQRMKMPSRSTPNATALFTHCMKWCTFLDTLKDHPELRPKEKALAKLFISQLQPIRLRTRVKARDPTDLFEAMKTAKTEVRNLERAVTQLYVRNRRGERP